MVQAETISMTDPASQSRLARSRSLGAAKQGSGEQFDQEDVLVCWSPRAQLGMRAWAMRGPAGRVSSGLERASAVVMVPVHEMRSTDCRHCGRVGCLERLPIRRRRPDRPGRQAPVAEESKRHQRGSSPSTERARARASQEQSRADARCLVG